MSKQMISLTAKDGKERLRFTVAGVKDGKFYDAVGTDYGTYDGEDVEFITEEDLNVSRLTGVRLEKIKQRADAYFSGTPFKSNEPVAEAYFSDEQTEEDEQPEIDVDALVSACKKAIKDGKFKKANKIIEKLDGHKVAKKLAKKLRKASE